MAHTSKPQKSADDSRSVVKTGLEIEKLQLETAKLKRDGTWYGQLAAIVVPMSVAMITAIVAVIGIVVSIGTFIKQGHDRSDDAYDKSLQQALSMATDGSAGSDRRVSGIYQLRDFWAKKAKDEQVVAATLTALVILPDTVTRDAASVRCAAAEFIGSAYGIPSAVTRLPPDDPRVSRIAQLLYGSADGPIGLVSRQNYLLRQIQDQHRKVQTGNSSPADFEDSVIATLGCATPLASTREAIRKNWENLRYTNLIFTDLSFSQLYEADLHGSRLDGVYLRGANLRCANLSGANLDKAAIDHSTDTTLLNTYLTMGEPNLPLTQTISLPDEDWLRWKKVGKFKMSALKKLLGPTFPDWASSFDENVCAQG